MNEPQNGVANAYVFRKCITHSVCVRVCAALRIRDVQVQNHYINKCHNKFSTLTEPIKSKFKAFISLFLTWHPFVAVWTIQQPEALRFGVWGWLVEYVLAILQSPGCVCVSVCIEATQLWDYGPSIDNHWQMQLFEVFRNACDIQ